MGPVQLGSAQATAYKVAGQLTLEERHALFQLYAAGTAVGAIAERLARHRSTIYREVGRNRKADGSYLPETARQMSARLATQDQTGGS
jgi:IS30 family transposase